MNGLNPALVSRWLQGYGLPYPLHFYHAFEQKGFGKPYPCNQAAPRDQCQKLDVTARLRLRVGRESVGFIQSVRVSSRDPAGFFQMGQLSSSSARNINCVEVLLSPTHS